MAMTTVRGTCKDGKVELAEYPAGIVGTVEVLVTFLTEDRPSQRAEEGEDRRRRAIALMEQGIPLGGRPYKNREELYDRTYRFDGTRVD
jgi:hypothetical protein